ncbi:YtxH domain-containing protein [Desulfurivibrio sp. C05AmB]|jgi:gas vesicle protein|uniref:YtxH domain-containing protein n=1 Tax=Desulfurivibrio sp. C05AmB TaxID=3374371 RepID=UPI00376F2323
MTHHHENCNSGLTVLSFLAGAVTGAAIALLVAPKSGRETREMLAGYGEEIRDKCRHLPDEVREHAGSAVERGRAMIDQGKELIEKGSQLASEGKEYLDEKKKTLSAAIEAGKKAMAREKEVLDQALQEKE